MLHILWLILKIILILLGAALGLVLLAVLLILFCPVRYRVTLRKGKDDWKQSEGQGCVSWLFHAVTFRAVLENGEVQTVFRVFGIPVLELLKKRKKRKKKHRKTVTVKDSESVKKGKSVNSNREESTAQLQEKREKDIQNTALEQTKKAEIATLKKQTSEEIQGKNTEHIEKEDAVHDRKNPVARIRMRIQNIFIQIRDKLHNIRKKIKAVHHQISWWKAFLEHPKVKAAISLVWKHAKFLLKHILPVKVEGEVTFSTEDPSLSGVILAVLGMSIPFHKNCVDVIPLFNGENYLQGHIDMRGRAYGVVFVRAALIIYFNENIKYVIKRWKYKED